MRERQSRFEFCVFSFERAGSPADADCVRRGSFLFPMAGSHNRNGESRLFLPSGGSTTGGQRPPLRRDGAGVGTSIARPPVFGNEALIGGRPMVGPTTEDGTPWPPLQGEVSPPPAAVTEGYVPSPAGGRLWVRGAKKLPRLPGGASPRMPCRLNSNLHTKAGGSPKFCFTASNVRPGPGGLQSADSNRHPL